MRLVVQRVNKASVTIEGSEKTVGKISKGLFVLVGVGEEDSKDQAGVLAEKLSKLRIMRDKKGKMNLSIKDVKGKVLAVSQFTLFADTSKGNRPSFIKAAKPVETGEFGAYMKIEAELDGPVTIIM
jgi:D-tyrosyl-tRNA(Tyr) deacylase